MHLLRGCLSFFAALAWMGLGALPWVAALTVAAPLLSRPRRLAWISTWARTTARGVLGCLRLGGARYTRTGTIPSDGPGIIVMNHQSVLDIPTAILMAGPLVPAFVARIRYASAPVVASGMKLAGCPVIDPHRDREGALWTMRHAVREDRTFLIYPEGHRTSDGALQPFRSAGLRAMLEERRVPVWLVATEGFCAGRNLVDFMRHVGDIDGRTEVVGRYDPPPDAAELDAFLLHLHAELSRRLAAMRAGRACGRVAS